jgi:hypothetical protein
MNLSPHNHSRAEQVNAALATLGRNGDSDHETLIDLLTDAMHWCDANCEDFHYCLAMACRQYVNELNDEQQDERRMHP